MNHSITPNLTKQPCYPLAGNSYGSLILTKQLQKKPMAQEIRNPLTAIDLALEMLISSIPTIDDTQKTYLDIIKRSSKKIDHLVTAFIASGPIDETQSKKIF
jgi:signal transduction histidine kinase